MEEKFFVISFNSTHHAIKGEKLFKEHNLNIKMMPTPREITASCGLSIRFEEEDLQEVQSTIDNSDLSIKGIYEMKREEGVRLAQKIN
ncbi:hypothetical protein DUF3343 [Gottschalkia acidurici 9a]|uniref:Putative Se/S carrier protein-like domain-containing protein n=1 Tax=Gottschalkia acidurici (strain ATCC 7906 / DSM 604 / BCRC 14475 / CIP 104303 / KCTC 5404 / NCIMB 10678 / 9a) TaxID=1128398 RepID=K0B311_GOTA9|nr:DUF3343 domain-containing protein [Gottschalkia acidurici]AFS79849.1 hypothetical protein DUF3343 [Gottschalkia acidurici 9a]